MSEICIVTGASGGIGSEAAIALGKKGASVVVNYRKNKEGAEQTAQKIIQSGGKAEIFCADVSDWVQVVKMTEFTLEKFGRIDVLVNNAGVALAQMPFDMTDQAQWDKIFSVNVYGTFNCTKAVIPSMVHFKKGSILNLSSVWGIAGGSCEAVYSASKAAIIGFTKAMAQELAPSGIRVNALAPGMIDTKMNSHLSLADIAETEKEIPLGRMGTAEEIGEIAAFLCLNESSYITGEVIKVDGGWF